MDYPNFANIQDYLQGLYDTANRSRLARGCAASQPAAAPGLLARLRRGIRVSPLGGSNRPHDRFEDDFLTLTLHVG